MGGKEETRAQTKVGVKEGKDSRRKKKQRRATVPSHLASLELEEV